jgi:hypothetical protein
MSLPARAYEHIPAAALMNRTGADAPNVVNIADDSGGYVAQYAMRMYTLKEARNEVHFEGRCDSACTLFLALPPQQTCVSPGAYFRFHAPSAATADATESVRAYMMRKYPKWVRSWISGQGGLSSQLITMNYAYASRFMRTCA